MEVFDEIGCCGEDRCYTEISGDVSKDRDQMRNMRGKIGVNNEGNENGWSWVLEGGLALEYLIDIKEHLLY